MNFQYLKKTLLLQTAMLLLAGVKVCTAQEPEFQWAASFGGYGVQWLRDVSIAPDGSVLVCGFFEDQIEIEGIQLLADGPWENMFFAKFDSSGKLAWLKKENKGSVGLCRFWAEKISGTPDGGVLVSGHYSGETYIGGNLMPLSSKAASDPFSYVEVFLAKYDSEGNFLWVKNTHTSMQNAKLGCHEVTSDGDIVELNIFEYPFVVDNTDSVFAPDTSLKAGYCFIRRDSNGNIKKHFQIPSRYSGPALQYWKFSGNYFYFTAYTPDFYSASSFPDTIYSSGIAKIDTAGSVAWVQNEILNFGVSFVIDKSDNIYITGPENDITTIGGFTIYPTGYAPFVLKINKEGEVKSYRSYGAGQTVPSTGIKLYSDQIVIGGLCSNEVEFGNFPMVDTCMNEDWYSGFLVGISNPENEINWALNYGNCTDIRTIDMEMTDKGEIFAAGYYLNYYFPAGDTLLTNSWWGTEEAFIVKYKFPDPPAQPPCGGGDFVLYPNPGSGKIFIRLNGPEKGFTRITVYNSMGAEILRTAEQGWACGAEKVIDLNGLTEGIYLIKINTNGEESILKWIKQ